MAPEHPNSPIICHNCGTLKEHHIVLIDDVAIHKCPGSENNAHFKSIHAINMAEILFRIYKLENPDLPVSLELAQSIGKFILNVGRGCRVCGKRGSTFFSKPGYPGSGICNPCIEKEKKEKDAKLQTCSKCGNKVVYLFLGALCSTCSSPDDPLKHIDDEAIKISGEPHRHCWHYLKGTMYQHCCSCAARRTKQTCEWNNHLELDESCNRCGWTPPEKTDDQIQAEVLALTAIGRTDCNGEHHHLLIGKETCTFCGWSPKLPPGVAQKPTRGPFIDIPCRICKTIICTDCGECHKEGCSFFSRHREGPHYYKATPCECEEKTCVTCGECHVPECNLYSDPDGQKEHTDQRFGSRATPTEKVHSEIFPNLPHIEWLREGELPKTNDPEILKVWVTRLMNRVGKQASEVADLEDKAKAHRSTITRYHVQNLDLRKNVSELVREVADLRDHFLTPQLDETVKPSIVFTPDDPKYSISDLRKKVVSQAMEIAERDVTLMDKGKRIRAFVSLVNDLQTKIKGLQDQIIAHHDEKIAPLYGPMRVCYICNDPVPPGPEDEVPICSTCIPKECPDCEEMVECNFCKECHNPKCSAYAKCPKQDLMGELVGGLSFIEKKPVCPPCNTPLCLNCDECHNPECTHREDMTRSCRIAATVGAVMSGEPAHPIEMKEFVKIIDGDCSEWHYCVRCNTRWPLNVYEGSAIYKGCEEGHTCKCGFQTTTKQPPVTVRNRGATAKILCPGKDCGLEVCSHCVKCHSLVCSDYQKPADDVKCEYHKYLCVGCHEDTVCTECDRCHNSECEQFSPIELKGCKRAAHARSLGIEPTSAVTGTVDALTKKMDEQSATANERLTKAVQDATPVGTALIKMGIQGREEHVSNFAKLSAVDPLPSSAFIKPTPIMDGEEE